MSDDVETVRAALAKLPREILKEPFPENPAIDEMKAIRSYTQVAAEQALDRILVENERLRECIERGTATLALMDEKAEAERQAKMSALGVVHQQQATIHRYEEALRVYTSHLHLCSTRPCSCGAYTSLLEVLPSTKEESE